MKSISSLSKGNILYDTPCSNDYLEIANEKSVAVGKYCGWHTNKVIYIGGNEAVLTFHSDSSTETRGFYLFLTLTQPCKCNDMSTSLSLIPHGKQL